MGSAFEPARQFGISPKNYESYWDGVEDTPVLTAKPQGGAAPVAQAAPAPEMYALGGGTGAMTMLSPYNPLSEEDEKQKFNEYLAQRRAQKDAQAQIQQGNVDFTGQEGASRLQNWAASGAVDPKVISQIHGVRADKFREEKDGPYTTPPPEVAKGVASIRQLDPTSPTAMQDLINIGKSVPDIYHANPHFSTAWQNHEAKLLTHQAQQGRMDEINANRKNSDKNLAAKALMDGTLTPDELAALRDEDGSMDSEALMSAIGQATHNKAIMTPDMRKYIDTLEMTARKGPTKDQKIAILEEAGINPEAATPDQWSEAYKFADKRNKAEYASQMNSLKQQGYKNLPRKMPYGDATVAQPVQQDAQQLSPQADAGRTSVKTAEDYAKLKSGEKYITSDGKKGTKK